jgi:ribonuclease P protein component
LLAAAARLRRREDFTATVRAGRRATRGALVVHLTLPTAPPDPARPDPASARAGFVVSKAVGDAVTRNKVKRRLRHLVRAELGSLPSGADVVVRALPDAASRSYAQLEIDLREGIEAALRRGGRR